MVIRRGQIWWVGFREPRGSEVGYRRPAIVVQCETANRSALPTVVVCPMTSNLRIGQANGNTTLRKRVTGLALDSVANASQLTHVNRAELEEFVGTLPRDAMAEVEAGIRWFLQLDV